MGITKEELEKSDELCAAALDAHQTLKSRRYRTTNEDIEIISKAQRKINNYCDHHNPDYIKRLNAYVRELELKNETLKTLASIKLPHKNESEVRADERTKVMAEVLENLKNHETRHEVGWQSTGDVINWLESEWKKEENV